MDTHCVKHTFERSVATCKTCNHPFCVRCLVYPKGPKKPPFCVECALLAAGIRSTAGRPSAAPAPAPKEDRRAAKARRRAEQAAGVPTPPPAPDVIPSPASIEARRPPLPVAAVDHRAEQDPLVERRFGRSRRRIERDATDRRGAEPVAPAPPAERAPDPGPPAAPRPDTPTCEPPPPPPARSPAPAYQPPTPIAAPPTRPPAYAPPPAPPPGPDGPRAPQSPAPRPDAFPARADRSRVEHPGAVDLDGFDGSDGLRPAPEHDRRPPIDLGAQDDRPARDEVLFWR